jgi:glucose-6-phosphate 1-dehydrogenase
VLQAWNILEDLLKNPAPVITYEGGTWGPTEADELIPGGWTKVGLEAEALKDSHH